MRIILLLSVWLILAQAPAFALDIIPLQHRSATELVVSLRPFVSAGGVIRAHNNQLIIKTTPENLIELKQLIRKLDRAARRLLITVRQPLASEITSLDIAVNGQRSQQGNQLTMQIQSTRSRDQAVTDQHIQTLEGYPATIQVGQEIPITHKQGQAIVRYKRINSGFSVIPRLNGDQVTLEINPQVQNISIIGGDAINVHRAQSTVRGKLGEWIALGGSAEIGGSQQQRTLYSSRKRDKKERQIFIKVIELGDSD